MKASNFNKFFRNIKKKNALILLLISIGLVYILFDQRGLIQRMRLASEKGSLEDRIERLRVQNDSMRVEITKLQTSDKEIERIAREKYFMHRNGEKVIKVEPK
jgi:cell division protein FtsB